MIKVMIADDEQRARLYMQKILDWEALGFEIIGVAANGEQVLELLENGKPDIALLDINMPKMNGIDLTARLKEVSPKTRVVFITGYSEFEYARKAVQLGVEEYLLKPFTKDELLKILLRLREKIQKEQEEFRKTADERAFLREELLRKLFYSEDGSEYMDKLWQLDVHFDEPLWRVCVADLDRDEENEIFRQDEDLWRFGIRNILEELLERHTAGKYLFPSAEGSIVLLIGGDEGCMEQTVAVMEELCRISSELLGISVTVGIGPVVASPEEIADSSRKSLIALRDRFLSGGGKVICYEESLKKDHKAEFYRMDLNDQLLIYLRRNDADKTAEILRQVEKEMTEKHYSMDYVNAAVMGILSICLSYIVEMKGDIQEILGTGFSPYRELQQKASMKDCFTWLDQIFQKTIRHFARPHSRRAEEIIEDVEKYIQEHYADFELSVDDIADAVFLDISYIRRIFSKYRNCTVLEYITAVRMRAAKDYLSQGIYSVGEVSEKCGYIDAGYFGRCFKKYYQVTPKQYLSRL